MLSAVTICFFHLDPTFAPAGKTAGTCFLPTRYFVFWADLQRDALSGGKAQDRGGDDRDCRKDSARFPQKD
jgi:hypothetical protein